MTDAPALVVFGIVYAVIAGTELLDRTNFALIGLSAKQPPLPTWAGAAGAFALTSALAVVIGAGLVALLHGQLLYLRLGGGVLLLGYAAYLAVVPSEDRRPPAGRSAAVTAFILILLLELGDTTMIFLIVFVSTFGSLALVVLLAGSLALATVAAVACMVGSRLGARVEPRLLDRLVVVILAVIGVTTVLYALAPGLFPALP